LATVGDINGDGKTDYLGCQANASWDNATFGRPVTNGGHCEVVLGSASLPATTSSTGLNGTNGFRLDGTSYDSQYFGANIFPVVGDINGDGKADMVISESEAGSNGGTQKLVVIFGKAAGWTSPFDFSALNGTTGFYITNTAPQYSSIPLLAIGDVDGDGYGDFLTNKFLVFGVHPTKAYFVSWS
jgi:hypothetical protein